MKFPALTASNLEGRKYKLPGDFEGEVNLLLIAFQQWQQSEIDTWVPLARQLTQAYPAFRYYELPTIDRSSPLFRFWLDSAMRFGIPDRAARAATITLYLDKPAFRQSLDIASESDIHLRLVDRQGAVLWSDQGRYSSEKEQALRQACQEALSRL